MKTDETRFNQIRCGKCTEIHLFLCVARDAGEGGTFDLFFNLKYSYSCSENFGLPNKSYFGPLIVCHFRVAP